MKKIIIILIAIVLIILIAFAGWFFLLRDKEIPVGEALRDILPFGSGEDVNLPTTGGNGLPTDGTGGTGGELSNDSLAVPEAKLVRISNVPVAGAIVLNRGASTTIVRFVDRATGHIYDVNLATLEKTKIVNQTLPKIYEAYFKQDGNTVLLRSLKNDSDTIENMSVVLTAPKATSTDGLYTISSTLLRGDIGSVAIGSGNTLFYTLRDTSTIVSSAFDGTGVKTILTSALNNWRLAIAGTNLIIHSKASVNVPGVAYDLNTTNGSLTKIIGPKNGLVAIPDATGDRALYSYVDGNRTRLFVQNLKTNTESEILPTTLAEKCIWGIKKVGILFCAVPTSGVSVGEPDNWYRGLTHFSDQIWLFNRNSEIAQLISEPKRDLDVDIDVFEPKLSTNEDYLIFTNKTDLSLWALKLEQP